jgi:signal transduction histidine kinase
LRIAILAFMAVASATTAFGQSGANASLTPLTEASLMLDASPSIPPDSAAWQAQRLPDNWSLSRPGVGGFAWYRIELQIKPDQLQLSALHVPRFSMNGMAYFNGEFIGGDGRFDEPTGRQWYRPQLFQIPAQLLRPGLNVIHIRIKAYPSNRGGLSQVYFGPAAAVQAQWERRWFWQVTSLQITTAITLGLSALAFVAWTLSGFGSAYGYFGAGALIWGLRNTHFLFSEIPIPAVYWEVLVATSLMWVLVLVSVFEVRFANRSYPKSERFLLLYCASAPFIVWAAGTVHLALAITLCYAVLLVMGAFILALLVDEVRRNPSAHTVLSLCASLVVYSLATHDFVIQSDAAGFAEPYKLHFGAPIMFSVVALNMFQRFRDAKTSAEELALNLETRVEQKNQELSRTYEALRQVEAAQAKAQERGRIMQDMHDGLGSQLVSSLAMAQGGGLSSQQTYDLLRSCIDDLRLAIDTSTDSRDSLSLALGNLRFRMEPRLKAAGISLKWNTLDLADDLPMPVEKQLPILRVIQETITNTLKHAHAKTLNVTVSSSATDLTVEISDDGHGFNVEAATQTATGKGLNSLDKRARVLGATLLIESSEKGTRTHLALPLA